METKTSKRVTELDGRIFALPWFVVPHGFEGCGIHAKDGTVIIARGLGKEMAAFIVQAVNSYDRDQEVIKGLVMRLVTAAAYLSELAERTRTPEIKTGLKAEAALCRAAIAKAEGR